MKCFLATLFFSIFAPRYKQSKNSTRKQYPVVSGLVLVGSKQCPPVSPQLTFMYISPIHASMHQKYFKSQRMPLAGTPFCFTCFDLLLYLFLLFLDLQLLIWPPRPYHPPLAMPSCIRHTTPVSQEANAVYQTNSNLSGLKQ